MVRRIMILICSVLSAAIICGCSGEPPAHDTEPSAEALTPASMPTMLPVADSYVPDSKEAELLTRLVATEAGEYPYMTQVCLAALVLNRVEHPAFPSTLREVILEEGEFACVDTGELEGEVSSSHLKLARCAVTEAMSGCDPTGGALYYSPSGKAKENYVIPTYECGGMVFGG